MKAADIPQPPTIVIGRRSYHWERLDPAKADYGASWGLKGPQGFAAIIWDHGAYDYPMITACGLWSGGYPSGLADVEKDLHHVVTAGENRDSDHRITTAMFNSWKETESS